MAFLKNLAKGFMRSAVNQVGRDGGKVISNQIYGDSHSIPVRSVGTSNLKFDDISQFDKLESSQKGVNHREELISKGFKVQLFEYPLWQYGLVLVMSYLLPFGLLIAPIWWIYWAIKWLFKSKTSVYNFVNKGVYKADLRYSSGRRYLGNQRVKAIEKVQANSKEKKVYRIAGMVALFISVSSFYFWNYIFYSS